jgi:hypothetical protein
MASITSGGGFGLLVAVDAPFHFEFALLYIAVAFDAINACCRVPGMAEEYEFRKLLGRLGWHHSL